MLHLFKRYIPTSQSKIAAIGVYALTFLFVLGCGFKPVYDNGTILEYMDQIEIGFIKERNGQVMRNALLKKLHQKQGQQQEHLQTKARAKLDVDSNFNVETLGVIASSASAVSKVVGKVSFVLTLPEGQQDSLMFTVTRSITFRNRQNQSFATLTAEETAISNLAESIAEEAFRRIALYLGAGS